MKATWLISGSLATLSIVSASTALCDEAKITAAEQKKQAGLAVVLVGSDPGRGRDCRELAREVYKRPKLRPQIDELVAKSLCTPTAEGAQESSNAAKVSELRASLGERIDNAATQAVLVALASELSTRALLIVSAGKVGTLVRVVRAGAAPTAEPIAFDLMQLDPAKPIAWAELAETSEVMLEDSPKQSPKALAMMPRKSLAASIGKDPPAEEPAQFFESPWFWVAAGSVAAVGLAILIVSQTTNVGEGTVILQGKVLP